MLVLSRRIGDQVCIGGDVVVTVVAIRGGRVRLGIAAPSDVAVDRHEVRNRTKCGANGAALNHAAALPAPR